MKGIAIFLVFCTLWSSSMAQPGKDTAPESSSYGQWATNLFAAFLKTHHVNVNNQFSQSMFEKALKRSCNTDCALILAVTGLELKGKRLNNSEVQLDIKTFTEINNKGFIIQRRFGNGSNDFDNVGFVPGNGNSLSVSVYQLIDDNSYTGYTFYRLKQIDFDGNSSYSKIIKVNGFTQSLAVQVSPNPASSGKIRVKILGFEDARNNNILVTDARGRRVLFASGLDFVSDSHALEIGKLPPGWYFLKVFNQKEKATTSFIVN